MSVEELELEIKQVRFKAAAGQIGAVEAAVLMIELQASLIHALRRKLAA